MRWYMKRRRVQKCKKSANTQEAKCNKGKSFRTGVIAGGDIANP